MRWLLLGILLAAVLCGAAGFHIEHAARSEDEAVGAVVPWLAAGFLVALDVVILLVVLARGLRG